MISFPRRLLRDERGIALPTALIVLSILTIIATSLIVLARGNGRSAELSDSQSTAFSLAEAGSAEALSQIRAATDPLDPTLVPNSGAIARDGGTVTYSAVLDAAATPPVWTITSTGTVDNPTGPGGADLTRTVTTQAELVTSTTGLAQQWDRMYHDHPTRCLVIEEVTLRGSITSRGDICLKDRGKIVSRDDPTVETWVRVGDDLFVSEGGGVAGSRIGDANDPIDRFDAGDACRRGVQPPSRPCSSFDKVYADQIGTDPGVIAKPEIDLDFWYLNAEPGPRQNCTVGSFPGGFDNNGFRDRSRNGSGEITPTNSSYTCQVWRSGEKIGELSWNHLTHILNVHGTIFIDGDVRFDDNGQLVNYRGRGIIYASGDLEFDELVCSGGDGTYDCHDDPSVWDPETNLLILLSGGWSEYDQGSNLEPTGFQGIVYATDHCLIHQDFHVSGPVICDEIRIEEDDEDEGGGWPEFFDWPQLESLVDGVISPSAPIPLDVVVREETS